MFEILFVCCLLLGAFVGVIAGLLGIGGGLVIVPALVYLFTLMAFPPEHIMPMAIATSLATIIFTSTSAAIAHHKNKNVPWQLAKPMTVVVAIGASSGAFIAELLSVNALTNFFAIGVICLASYMFFTIASQANKPLPKPPMLMVIGLFTGVIASLMGIAGGAILVPVMSFFGLAVRHAIGLATVCGVGVAVFGSVGFVVAGLNEAELPSYSLGYIYLPAFLGIVITSSYFAKVGVKLAAKLPVKKLKKIFAFFLILVAIKMMLS